MDTGIVAGGVHRFGLRIYFEDTDAGGIVYHANYLRYAERGRSEALRALGVPHAEMIRTHGRMFVVHRAEIDYERPARLDDRLIVATHVKGIAAARVTLEQVIWREAAALARVHLVLACIDAATGRPARLPGPVRDALVRMRADEIAGGAIAVEGV
ncbi:tol-pal system-associated acyl-CoA thioesterase [Acidiphilium sp. AL]|uniref:tol-pal system-associated acyl-CoA thioesterase n=1 Tax=Acidiphilium sp. AL TaxID=2871704 RepID=UPI0021CB437C|nr:tol-pal system-associated acyl-CoA thioesterase [Acidiphilium sp. AL]MCU4161007.1 tol-pal system-associated acyl-CoA thioesterase [Acidiphilium sp. AL]